MSVQGVHCFCGRKRDWRGRRKDLQRDATRELDGTVGQYGMDGVWRETLLVYQVSPCTALAIAHLPVF